MDPLEHQMLRPGVLEAAGLAGWQLLARKFPTLLVDLWALLERLVVQGWSPRGCRPAWLGAGWGWDGGLVIGVGWLESNTLDARRGRRILQSSSNPQLLIKKLFE